MAKVDRLRAQLAARHDSPLFRAIASVTRKYLRAYDNELNWDMRFNGEAFALSRIIREIPGQVLDVGANEGQWAIMALEIIGRSHLHCFEAVPATFERLRRAIGSRSNVSFNDIGLGSEAKTISVYFYPDSTDRTSAFDLRDGFNKEVLEVRIIRGDEYVEAKDIDQISFLKIDVEGMEMDVLQGFETTFQAGIIKAVQFEHGPVHVISRHFLKDFVEFFNKFNFEVYECFPNMLRKVAYDINKETFVGKNFVAIPPDVAAVSFPR
jgi:FkbM family methyltransferase